MTKVLKQFARNEYFWLVLILGLGFSLRLYGLADVAVSNDEGIVYSRWISVSFREIMIDDLILHRSVTDTRKYLTGRPWLSVS